MQPVVGFPLVDMPGKHDWPPWHNVPRHKFFMRNPVYRRYAIEVTAISDVEMS
jgi:hypothetical protein